VTVDEAERLDTADPLAFARKRFSLPDSLIYLDGNSLGALPKAAPSALATTAERQWGQDLIASWNKHQWIDWPAQIAARLAPIVGAKPGELLIADSTSVCLFKLLAAAVGARPGRRTIVSQQANFPTDLYVAQGLAEMLGLQLKTVPGEQVVDAIGSDTAVVTITHVDYRSAAVHDMRALNDAAHAAGALTVWDLSHSAGAVPVDLNGCEADLAVGCGYKYLNGGPGAPAFAYVARRHQAALRQPITGWMGHAAPFAFSDDYAPAPGIERLLTGTPPILGLAALEEGVRLIAEIGVELLAAKSRALAQFLRAAVAEAAPGLPCVSPDEPAPRGSHLSFRHPEAYAVVQALIARGVIPDYRDPDILRLGLAPAYLRFEDCRHAAQALGEVLASGEWQKAEFHHRSAVT